MPASKARSKPLPQGWFSEWDIQAYRKLYRTVPARGQTAELGVWQGRSLCSLAGIIRRKKLSVHAIDSFAGTVSEKALVHDCDGKMEAIFRANLRRFGLTSFVTVLSDTTLGAGEALGQQSFDLIFFDADHEYDQIAADLDTWLPKLREGGTACGHDFQRPGVWKAIVEKFGRENLQLHPNSSVWSVNHFS